MTIVVETHDALIAEATTSDSRAVYAGETPDTDQSYFFTPRWQALVADGEADLAAGRVAEFDTVEDLLADLDL
jgi:hypothetical protein